MENKVIMIKSAYLYDHAMIEVGYSNEDFMMNMITTSLKFKSFSGNQHIVFLRWNKDMVIEENKFIIVNKLKQTARNYLMRAVYRKSYSMVNRIKRLFE